MGITNNHGDAPKGLGTENDDGAGGPHRVACELEHGQPPPLVGGLDGTPRRTTPDIRCVALVNDVGGSGCLDRGEGTGAAGERDTKRSALLARAKQTSREEALNEAKRRRDLLANAKQPGGEKAPSAAAEREAKRRQNLLAKTKPTGEEAPSAAAEPEARRRRDLLTKTKPISEG